MPLTIYSADASASSQTASSSSLLQKINQIKQEIASKAAQIKKDVNQKLANKFFWGKVISKTSDSISLSTLKGAKFANINEFTTYESSKGKISVKDVKTDDYIAALGDIDDKGNLVAKRIVKITPPKQDKQIIWGQLQKISGVNLILKTKEGEKNVVLIPGATYFYGKQEASSSAMGVNSTVILTGIINDQKVMNSSFIYIIPQSTSTAKPATSSASPKR